MISNTPQPSRRFWQDISLDLAKSRGIKDYEPLFRISELGARFPKSMENWCGIGERPYPLKFWQVFLARDREGNSIGVSGLYQQEVTDAKTVWLGWFGIVPEWRGRGMGPQLLKQTLDKARELHFEKVLVYCEKTAEKAISFYLGHDFHILGEASLVCQETTTDPTDLVLSRNI